MYKKSRRVADVDTCFALSSRVGSNVRKRETIQFQAYVFRRMRVQPYGELTYPTG